MYTLEVPNKTLWNDRTQEFVDVVGKTIKLEHSLVSLARWESKWHTYYLNNEKLTAEQKLDYIRCMTITQDVDPNLYYAITPEQQKDIHDYINDPMTGTVFSNKSTSSVNSRFITNEVIYSWMFANNIPIECQKWHLNRLLTLIRVCNEEKQPPKKKTQREIMEEQRARNKARRAALGTKG